MNAGALHFSCASCSVFFFQCYTRINSNVHLHASVCIRPASFSVLAIFWARSAGIGIRKPLTLVEWYCLPVKCHSWCPVQSVKALKTNNCCTSHLQQSDMLLNPPPQPFYGPFSGTTRVSRCQKRTSGLYGAREG